MATDGYRPSNENGGLGRDDLDDTFEQDLRNMLRDSATLSSDPMGSGLSPGGQFTGIDLSSPQKSPATTPNIVSNPVHNQPHVNANVGSRLARGSGIDRANLDEITHRNTKQTCCCDVLSFFAF